MAAKNFSLSAHINKACDQILFDALNDTSKDWGVEIWKPRNTILLRLFMWQSFCMLEMGYDINEVFLISRGLG